MANITSQSTRSSGRTQNYAKKDAVAISAVNASVPMFEQRLAEIRTAHAKDGFSPKVAVGEDGKPHRDESGAYVVETDAKGRTIYEAKYVQAYSLVQSFGHDELDPDDPDSWTRANALGRALAEDRFPGHPVLIATEINGRSGCVHNHLVVGATHPETGRQIDSNIVTHSRLALAHDRVLAEHGFEQREDMKQMALTAAEQMKERRAEVMSAAPEDISRTELNRRLLAAENSVRFDSKQEMSPTQRREAKRLREFDRYRLNEEDRTVALDIGITPPKEKFSEIELEGRIKDTLSDPRATSWETLAEIGRENRVTIEPRGEKDVTYGMMLAQPDGTIAEPARAHRRRGGVKGAKSPGLGDGFRRTDVEAAIARNVEQQREAQVSVRSVTDEVLDVDMSFLDEYRIDSQQAAQPTEEQIRDRREREELAERVQAQINEKIAEAETRQIEGAPEPEQTASQPEIEQPQAEVGQQAHEAPASSEIPAEVGSAAVETKASVVAETPVAETVEEPAFRSQLRDRNVKVARTRTKLDELASLEEDYHGRQPDAEFEQRLVDKERVGGVGPQVLSTYGDDMSPDFRTQLQARTELRAAASSVSTSRQEKLDRAKELADKDGSNQRHSAEIRNLRNEAAFDRQWIADVRDQVAAGDYSPRDYDSDRHENRKEMVSRNAAELEGTDIQKRLERDKQKLRGDRAERTHRDQEQDQDLERG